MKSIRVIERSNVVLGVTEKICSSFDAYLNHFSMFYLIDKPLGISSFDVIRSLRKTLQEKKMWHAGTLDPLATGCLLIATGKSTKLLCYIGAMTKRYIFSVRIDGFSDSYDLWTRVTSVNISDMIPRTPWELCTFLSSQAFQIPPKYSALHVDGERAYNLVRDDCNFVLPKRPIQVSDVEILDFSPPCFKIVMTLSSGGYVRSFAPLIGNFFGIWCAWYITALRRIELNNSYTTLPIGIASILQEPYPIDESIVFPTFHTIEISEDNINSIRSGRSIQLQEKSIPYVFLVHPDNKYRSLCSVDQDGIVHIIRNDV